MANLYYKKKLYQTVMTNKSITVIPTTKTGLYKVQAVIVCMDKGGLQCAVVNIYCTLRVVNNCISFIEINNLLCLNCQYAPQNTRTYFARLQNVGSNTRMFTLLTI